MANHPMTPGAVIYQRQGVTISLLIVSLGLVLSLLGNLYQMWAAGTIHYTTVGGGIRASRPGEIPRQALRDVAKGIVLLMGNGTAAGLAENWADAERYMSDSARHTFAAIRAEQMEIIKAGTITLTTEAIQVVGIEEEREKLFRVDLTALQTVKYGLLDVGAAPIQASVWLTPGKRDSIHGLWVIDLKWPPLSTPRGAVSAR